MIFLLFDPYWCNIHPYLNLDKQMSPTQFLWHLSLHYYSKIITVLYYSETCL